MAMMVVELVLERLATLIAEETQLLSGVRDGIEELKVDLSSMRSFLQDAEARSESDPGAKDWVKQVRDLAYDAEDVLEKFMLDLAAPQGEGFVHSLRSCYGCTLKLRAQHRIAVQLQSLKVRIRSISERRSAFSFQKVDINAAAMERWHDPRIASLYLDEAEVVGIDNPKALLIKWLVEGGEKLCSISVVGMGGLGKTTLVKKVYDSQPLKRCFDCHSWVTVSKSFSPTELLRAAFKGFLEEVEESARQKIESMTDFQLVDTLRKHLLEKRYVIVFDDVWSSDVWEAVKYAFPDGNFGSRIVFTTRLGSLPASVDNTAHVYLLQPLPEEEAWTLFCRKAFRGEYQGVCPQGLEAMSLSILKKCEGLPLAIAVIGGLLSKKNKEVREWKKVHDSLAAELQSDKDLGGLGRILLLSYNDLPYYLKQCYLYLSVFPEDYLIKRMKLIRLWVVERFVQEKQGLTLEEVAEDYLNELVARNMIQVVQMDYFKRVRTCRVHDLIRELILHKSREESLVVIANNELNISKNEKVRRLSIHDGCKDLPSSKRAPYLRSLLQFVSFDTFSIFRHASFHGFKLLRILEMEGARISNFPLELVDLIHLRYLSFRWSLLRVLPESIKRLANLEILDLKGSLVASLPLGILQLQSLCQLRNYRFEFGSSAFFPDSQGMRVPSGIGRLTSLQKLGSVEVFDDCNLVKELGKLTQLRRLGILKLKEQHGMDLCYTLERLKHLTALYTATIKDTEYLQLDALSSPPENLQRLFLKCRLSRLPEWVSSLQYLSKLVLQYSNLKNDPLQPLGELPSLVVLELRQAYDGGELNCNGRGFFRLRMLSLCQMERLRTVRVAAGAMPGLRRLDIVACHNLEKMPLGTEHLTNIQDLLLCDMPSTFFKRIEQYGGEDFARVQHIPTITRIY
ncbi:hypothetical protein Tsubulata_047682 [Turnera subulata]|uniref:Disease resistance protein RPM1-like n=1 Tax=Turnera subulata TaxID=218843 RepID=A0A9Q0FRQ4_9ROSI|nr:hypothetical protein Tsubulata_047682 [Turnera subulata]